MKKVILTLIMFLVFGFTIKAECTDAVYASLVFEAKELEYNYSIYDTGLKEEYPLMRYRIIVSNITPNLLVQYGDDNTTITSRNNVITNLMPGQAYFFSITGSLTSECPGRDLSSKYVTLPEYNAYINTDECIESPEFKYCDKDKSVSEMVSYENFIDSYYTYYSEKINKDETPEIIAEPNSKKTIDIKWIIIPLVSIILVVVIIRIIIVRKRRII
ncbi:MAG TPA: hypothetical protein PKY25_00060 [Bacilli bacterium]|nr:hypothetical protein [Bacilli bacterium]